METPRSRALGWVGLVIGAYLSGACAPHTVPVSAARVTGPDRPWQPPADEPDARQAIAAKVTASSTEGITLPPPDAPVTLDQVIDLALKNNPRTRATWAAARAAAAEVGSRRAGYYPEITLSGQAGTQRLQFSSSIIIQRSNVGLTAGLTWLLFDFGGQQARVAEARQALLAADWTHNNAIQGAVLQVEQAYYDYLAARAQAEAAESSAKDAQQNLAAAQARVDAGVGTRIDVLQARTARSQAQLVLESVRGQEQALRGALATRLGVPVDTQVEVGDLPAKLAIGEKTEAIDTLIERAKTHRADLAAAEYAVAQAQSRRRQTRADGLPLLSLSGSYSPTWYLQSPSAGAPAAWSFGNNYSAGVTLSFPLFNGFENRHDIAADQARVDVAEAQAEDFAQQVVLQVWTSYYDVQTAAQRVRTTQDLLASATESEEEAQARYQQGVGNILEVLSSQSALASARAQDVQARADWLVAVARLAHDTGVLGPAAQESP